MNQALNSLITSRAAVRRKAKIGRVVLSAGTVSNH